MSELFALPRGGALPKMFDGPFEYLLIPPPGSNPFGCIDLLALFFLRMLDMLGRPNSSSSSSNAKSSSSSSSSSSPDLQSDAGCERSVVYPGRGGEVTRPPPLGGGVLVLRLLPAEVVEGGVLGLLERFL
jgi:hypothetical protein